MGTTDSVQGKIARTSNLALRFYEQDGWTEEELNSLCVKGSFHCPFPSDEYKYWLLEVGSQYDVNKMMQAISHIKCTFPEQEKLTKFELLNEMNW